MSSLVGIGISLLMAVFKSSSEIISKRNLNSEISPYINAWALRAFALPVVLLALVIVGIPEITKNYFIALSVSGPIGIIATVLYMKGLEASDLSIISPLAALSPLLLLITTPLIVQEFPSVIGLIGVMVTTIGVYMLELGKKEEGWLAPFKALATEPGAKYIMGMLLLYSISAPVDKIGVQASSPVMYTVGLHIVFVAGLTPIMIYKGVPVMSQLTNVDSAAIVGIGVFSGLSSIAQMTALTYTLVIYVIAIKRAGIVFSVIFGGVLFDEPYTKQRLIGSIIIVIGIILVSLSLA